VPRTESFAGVALSDDCARAVAVDGAGLEPIAAGAARLTGTIADSVRESLRALHLRPAGVAAALGLDRATVRRMSLPRTAGGNVDRVVRFEAERHIPLPIENVELDYQAEPDTASDRLEVVVAAVRKEDAAQLARALADATAAPTILDTAGTALLAAWDAAHGGTGAPVLLVDLSGGHAALVVCQSGNLVLARSVPAGVVALRAALAEDLRVSLVEAETVRASRGVVDAEVGPPDLVAQPEVGGLERTSAWLTGLVQEVRRTLESFRSQRGGFQRCPVALTGEGADTPGLADALQRAIRDPVLVFDPFADRPLKLPGPGHEFTLAYGLALRAAGRSPVRLDLSPRAERAGRARRHRATGWVGLAAVAGLALVAAYVYASSRLERTERELRDVQAESSRLEKQVGDLKAAMADAEAVTVVEEQLAGLDRVEAQPLDLLAGISSSLPGGLWLTDFFYDQEKGLTLRGNALDAASVTEAVRALSRRPYLARVKLSSIAIVNIGAKPVYSFEIIGDFQKPEEPASAKKEPAPRKRP
jgi:type IV pilus assembly protein PilM